MSTRLGMGLVVAGLVGFLPYLVAVWRAPRWPWRRARWWVIGIAVLLRLVALPLPAWLTSDLHRYYWEGGIQSAGFNPYRYAPAAPELAGLRDDNWSAVEHREVPSSYPPLLLLLFRAVAGATGDYRQGELGFKLVSTGADLVVVALLVGLLRRRDQNPTLVLLWAWNPLVIIEFAGNGHGLSIAIMWFLAGLWALRGRGHPPGTGPASNDSARREPVSTPRIVAPATVSWAGAGLYFALAIQFHFLALIPVLAVALARRVRSRWFWAAFVPVLIAPLLLFADAGADLLTGLTHYAGRWRFNGSAYELLARLFSDEHPRQLLPQVWLAHGPAKLAGALVTAAVCGWAFWRRPAAPRAALAVTGTLLLMSSTVHPWYLTWLVALGVLEYRAAWLLWSGLVLLAYGGLVTGGIPGWLLGIEYGPVYILLIHGWLRRWVDRS